jgi:hypothetical protein
VPAPAAGVTQRSPDDTGTRATRRADYGGTAMSCTNIRCYPAFAAAAGLESRADPEPGIPWDQIGAEA